MIKGITVSEVFARLVIVIGQKVRFILCKIYSKNMQEETARLENLTPRPHGLVAGTMEYQEYFRAGTSSLSVHQTRNMDKLSGEISKLEKNTKLSDVEKVILADYKTSLKELKQKDSESAQKLDSIHALK